VRDALDAAERIDTAVGLALRLAAVTGARRAELCALRWTDLVGERLTIDSSIEIVRLGSVADKRKPTLVDAATKTANRRTVRLDPRTGVSTTCDIGRPPRRSGADMTSVQSRVASVTPTRQ